MTTDIACSYNFLIFLERIVSSKNLNYTATVKVCKLKCLAKVTIIKSEKDDSQNSTVPCFFGGSSEIYEPFPEYLPESSRIIALVEKSKLTYRSVDELNIQLQRYNTLAMNS